MGLVWQQYPANAVTEKWAVTNSGISEHAAQFRIDALTMIITIPKPDLGPSFEPTFQTHFETR